MRYRHHLAAIFLLTAHLAATQDLTAPWPDGPFTPQPSRLAEGVGEGYAWLEPEVIDAAAVGNYTLTFVVGASGIAEGGGLRVDFPKTWFTNPVPLVKPVQTNARDGYHHLGATTSRAETSLELKIEQHNFDGKRERFRHILHILVNGAPLEKYDQVVVTFANTTAPYIAGRDVVAVAVDTKGDDNYRLTSNGAEYEVTPGSVERISLVGPSQAVMGEPITFKLTYFDRFDNVATAIDDQCGIAQLSADVLVIDVFNGKGQAAFTFNEAGDYLPIVTPTHLNPHNPDNPHQRFGTDRGNPLRVFEQQPDRKIYWGDLHSHSNISKDGIGYNDFAYARDVAHLDFFASTEHDVADGSGDSITPAEWEKIREDVREFYEPGKFVTLLAYESSHSGGHHNVFYRDLDGVPWPGYRMPAIADLWERLERGNAITIPHHMGIRWGATNAEVTDAGLQPVQTAPRRDRGGPILDWSLVHDPELRPALEIYSKHGQSEYFDPDDPLSYEQVKYTTGYSVDGAHYAQDAWAAGLVMGAVAASDNHRAQPGLAHTGLTAVFAPELTRDAIFDALLNRRCYATTGERILLEFAIGNGSMGQMIDAEGEVNGHVFAAAPRNIARAEVLAYDFDEADGWKTIAEWTPNERELDTTFGINPHAGGTVAYLRLQLEGETNGRVARAWSSPIWINK